ncbi:hypothetical protein [Alteraurantiacibacter buctensis]|uniref:Uncharacterized protein n=1 Tax=Alteraurantiacibacter buctensis TaxID=1503981 RepID=A0A844Z4Y5_9SPHN|nr:hypothetical protein [Alteraurantiacibacter buctensis]MXO72893.1 hypothetical protein [Alteraurantiacibacter buctensis]
MTTRQSTARRTTYSASNAVDALARALTEIKEEDGLTDADIGAVLGKSDDQAAKYRTGLATMDAVTFGRGKREWNGRFTGYFDRLCEDSRPGKVCDHSTLTALLDLGAKLAKALENGTIDAGEVRDHRSELENVRDLIDAQLSKLRPGAAA